MSKNVKSPRLTLQSPHCNGSWPSIMEVIFRWMWISQRATVFWILGSYSLCRREKAGSHSRQPWLVAAVTRASKERPWEGLPGRSITCYYVLLQPSGWYLPGASVVQLRGLRDCQANENEERCFLIVPCLSSVLGIVQQLRDSRDVDALMDRTWHHF